MKPLLLAAFFAGSLAVTVAGEAPVRIAIETAEPGHAVSPLLHGIFFEDINYGADGGLYAELVQNRSFEHDEHFYSYGKVARGAAAGDLSIETADPLNAKNPHYLRLVVRDPGKGFGIANYGFGGIALRQGENYFFSIRARADAAFTGANGMLRAVLEDETGRPLGECKLEKLGTAWQPLEGTIKSTATAAQARLVVLATAAGRVDLDVVSLFPEHTFKNRRNGLRADLAQMLADLHPAFMRFPGGCIVEGMDLPNRYQWKDSIGDVAERPENWNRWQDAIRNQTAPQYYQTYGLGFFEYFQLCEDLGCEPLPILNCGMACQYQSKQLVPLDQLGPFVQDALDLIEFANGPADSPWGAKRAAMGHPAPFNVKYLGVGNEQWDEQYFERYKIFQAALKAKYPAVNLVTTAGPAVDEAHWKFAWGKFKGGTPADIVDEHYYRPPQWFLDNATRYDAQDRYGPKIFAGEFAAHDPRGKRNTLRAAIAEAAFMTGLVRNSDVVALSSYAPLFAKVGATQWTPDLIWFDNTRVYGSPSYYVQSLFARNRPDVVVPVTVTSAAPAVEPPPAAPLPAAPPLAAAVAKPLPALFAVAGRDERAGELIVTVVNPFADARTADIDLRGTTRVAPDARATVFTSASADDENSFEAPRKVAPRDEAIKIPGVTFPRAFPANSLTILRLKIRE
jgi:alpha-N-arabinofuranosidase